MIKSRLLKVIGLSKLEVGEKLKNILKAENNLSLELLANEIEVKVKIAAEGRDEKGANGMIETLENKIRERLGDYIFGVDEETLEKVVGVLLLMRKKTIALAESCSGGLISHRLTNAPGSSHYFQGSVVAYSNRVKANILGVPLNTLEKFGAVSRETVQAMVRGIRKISSADLGLAVTGIAGPEGGEERKPVGLVYIALAVNDDIFTEEHHLSGKRETIKLKASQAALDMVRRYLLKE
ncbi:nicotinamide-nucleotide amidohydrolase family protein [candidate division NPL-UPA2 bacterium]|nr:nicotinamide-nucleotide amidohydrolase family protein [candidate division NPL-UPA2 bacterium]